MHQSVAIITGASRGIGPHIARAMSAAGHPVVLVARTGSQLQRHADAIAADRGLAHVVQADITDGGDRRRIVEAARSFGPIGVLVNNAAVGPITHFDAHTTADIKHVVDINLTAPMELTRLVVCEMLGTGGGRIVNVSTVAAKLPMPDMVLYSVTKAGLAQFSAAIDLEFRDRGIRATTVFPGAVADEGMAVRAVEQTGVDIPNDGAVKPEVVARAVLAASRGSRPEVFVGTGSRFMTRHPRLAYALIRRGGVFSALHDAADRQIPVDQPAA